MATFSIDISKSEMLDELTDKDLQEELAERGKATYLTNSDQKFDLLTEAAELFRKNNKPAMALRCEELIKELQV